MKQTSRLLTVAMVAMLAGCAGAELEKAEMHLPRPVSAQVSGDEFPTVDCLLPGQVRKLGRKLTFLAPRRPVRTSQTDCEIRGGEYVSYDKASYGNL